MQLEVGSVYEGKITGITKFGAFVDFAQGKTGMVHISEIASTFVKEIKDFVTEGQEVKVKIIGISDEGKVSLSMKKAEDRPPQPPQRPQKFDKPRAPFDKSRAPRNNFRPSAPRVESPARPGDFEWENKPMSGGNFEDMMSKFKQASDEKISDLKRSTDTKRGGGFAPRRDKQK